MSFSPFGVATPVAWYKCRNSQNAQKCLRERAKGVFGPPERESQKGAMSRTVQTLFRTGQNTRQNTVSHRARDCFGTLCYGGPKIGHLSHSPLIRNAGLFIILFGNRNFRKVGLFAILAECSPILFEFLLIEIQEENHHFAGWEGGVKT